MTNSIDTAAALAAAKGKLAISAAYKFVALAVMLTNCNLFVQQTQLQLDHPLTFTNIMLSRCSVAPPRLLGFSGGVQTEKYFFGFGHDHLANFWQWEFRPQSNIRQHQIEWSQMTSRVDTNQVHALAISWLNNLGVDTQTMEQKYPCKITQRFYYKNSNGSLTPLDKIKVMLPIYVISWGSIPLKSRPEYNMPAVTMTIFGPTKELIEYHLFDDALMLRPKLEIKDFEKLLAIPNSDFKQYTKSQCDDLVKQFMP
jgi:acid stress-induced BolA-like protein IbaG/YrbA